MKSEKLRVSQLSAPVQQWYLDSLATMDAKDVERYGTFLADNCEMQINGNPWIRGKITILETLNAQWMSFDSVTQDLLNIYGDDSSFALEAVNHYRRNDGRMVSIPTVTITDRNEAGLAVSVRVYADLQPLFSTNDD